MSYRDGYDVGRGEGCSNGEYHGFHSRDNEVYKLKSKISELDDDRWDNEHKIDELENKVSKLEYDKSQLEYEIRQLENTVRQLKHSNWG